VPSKNIPLIRCPKCGRHYIPVKYSCTACGNRELEEVSVDSKTEIYSYTTIRVPPEIYKDEAPYHIALVRFDDIPDLLVTARVTCSGGAEISVGKEVVFTGIDELGYRFEII
jgi:uncharacterized OB-fold protein